MTDEFRLHQLEVAQDVQAQLLTAIQTELIKADNLGRSIERLGAEASTLAQALLQVDSHQQQLIVLGSRIEAVDSHSASQEDLDAVVKKRARTFKVLIAFASVLVFVLFLAGGLLLELRQEEMARQGNLQDICQQRNEQNAIIIGVLEGALRAPSSNAPPEAIANIERGLERFRALNVDCSKL